MINKLFEQEIPTPQRFNTKVVASKATAKAGVKSGNFGSGLEESCFLSINDDAGADTFDTASCSEKPRCDEGTYSEDDNTLSIPLPIPPSKYIPKVIARNTCPAEERSAQPQPQPRPEHELSRLQLTSPPALLLYPMLKLIGTKLIDDFTIPEIIDYDVPKAMANKTVRVEAQAVEFTVTPESTAGAAQQPEKVVGVVAMLQLGDSNGTGPTRTLPIMAKPKRLRKVMWDSGVRGLTEDEYSEEIRVAMGILQQCLKAKKSD